VDVWLRLLIGGGVGLVGAFIYLAMRIYMETTKRISWGDVVAALVVQAVGLSLADLGAWVLRPIAAPGWLRWAFVAFALAVCGACGLVVFRGSLRTNVGLLIVYYGGLFLGLLAISLAVDQVT
jgi:hypothetical protein